MSATIKGLTVTLAPEIRADRAEKIAKAIALLKGVVSVDSQEEDMGHLMAKRQVQNELQEKLYKALSE